MTDGKLGFTEVLSMAIGALIGGGIFAVLGVASGIAGQKVIFSYIISGIIALATGYKARWWIVHISKTLQTFR